jgi:acyl-CoA thioesterase-1
MMLNRNSSFIAVLIVTAFISSVHAADPPTKQSTAKKTASSTDTTEKNSEYVQIEDKPGLPRVLLIGDSISVGYTLPTRKLLEGKANVHRPGENCGPTTRGLEKLDQWLGDKKWDVIHFNFGLHDLKYVDETGKMVAVAKGKQNILVDQYEKNLRDIVARLKKTGAKLIWRNTTQVPKGANGREEGSEVKYNEVAAKVMKENNIPTHDMHKFIESHPEYIQKKNVHYSKETNLALAKEVATEIEAVLKK